MDIVTQYRTEDGQLFDNKKDAKNHEIDLKATKALRNLLNDAIRTGRVESVISAILIEAQDVSAILATYRKRKPKPSIEQTNQVAA